MTEISQAIAERSKTLGTQIQAARQAAQMSIEECAGGVHVSPEIFDAFENGLQAPSLPELEAIAYLLNTPLDNFWANPIASKAITHQQLEHLPLLINIRHRMIGAQIRQARLEGNINLEALARWTEIEQTDLEAYELGQKPIPLPVLEMLSGYLNRSIREFQDRHGPVGMWTIQQQAMQEFVSMPEELQEFISKPINRPYLELAMRLSQMSVDRLRAVAEGLLEITY